MGIGSNFCWGCCGPPGAPLLVAAVHQAHLRHSRPGKVLAPRVGLRPDYVLCSTTSASCSASHLAPGRPGFAIVQILVFFKMPARDWAPVLMFCVLACQQRRCFGPCNAPTTECTAFRIHCMSSAMAFVASVPFAVHMQRGNSLLHFCRTEDPLQCIRCGH